MKRLTAEQEAAKEQARGRNIVTYCVVSFALGGMLVTTFPQIVPNSDNLCPSASTGR